MSHEVTTTSLYEMLSRHASDEKYVNHIAIPRVQRDYAQGRTDRDATKIRNRFFAKLVDAVASDDSAPIVLDFVYGSLENGVFYPLDGQQRLTTLFLVHWYAAVREQSRVKDTDPDFYKREIPFLLKFKYLTRDSAGEFLTDLVTQFSRPDFSRSLSAQIEDAPWFPLGWKDDPTVAGMLVALDKLRDLFESGNVEGAWTRLTDGRKITFHCKFIDEMGVTDTIYIKMNSRGLPLTDFEHFKSEFESRLAKLHEQGLLDDEILQGYKNNLDKDWTDMLWNYRDKSLDNDPKRYMNNAIDRPMMRLLKYYFDMVSYKKGYRIHDDLFETLDEILLHDDGPVEILNLYRLLNRISEYADISLLFDRHLTIYPYKRDKTYIHSYGVSYGVNFFDGCVKKYGQLREFPYSAMLYLEAFVAYLLNMDTVSDGDFGSRLRIIRNLIANTDVSHRDDLPTFLLEVDDIVVNGFREGLRAFNGHQERQEWAKLQWIENHTAAEMESLVWLENHDMLRGNLHTLLKGADNRVDMSRYTSAMAESFYRLFPIDGDLNKSKKALLAVGDYGFTDGWRTFYGGRFSGSWYEDIFSSYSAATPSVVIRQALHRLEAESVDDLIKSIDTIDRYDWRYYIARYSVILRGPARFHTKGVYYWKDRASKPYKVIEMYTREKLNGRHWNPFLLTVYEKIKAAGNASGVSLDEYGSPIRIKHPTDEGKWLSVTISNSHLYIRDDDHADIFGPFTIPQDSHGIDIFDRVLWTLTTLRVLCLIP